MNKLKLLLGLVILFSMELSAQQSEQDKKMAWWREARFGMFIHWGPYAVWGGTIMDICHVQVDLHG